MSNMLLTNCIENLTGLQDVIINKIENCNNETHIYCSLKVKEHKCPCCGEHTTSIHDYREQIVKDVPAFGNNVFIHLRKRRYRCKYCGKRFQENNNFLPKYYRMTSRLITYILDKLRTNCSYTSVAKIVNLSVTTVIRIFDYISYPKPKLPKVLSIDEFKGNTGSEKYQCILTDPDNKVVLDILPMRYKHYLTNYFRDYDKESREKVNYFISDMWQTYADISAVWFKNAVFVVDKYHWIRQIMWAFENVRKQEQKKFSKTHRIYFKHSRKLLLKRFDELNDEQKQQVNVMLYASPTLSTAYFYKEDFLKILNNKDKEVAQKDLKLWIESALDTEIPQLVKCANTMINWFKGITNSLSTKYINGFTEGCNNKIKVLKRNAYGYRNFRRFRNRILHIF
jgi:transposase